MLDSIVKIVMGNDVLLVITVIIVAVAVTLLPLWYTRSQYKKSGYTPAETELQCIQRRRS